MNPLTAIILGGCAVLISLNLKFTKPQVVIFYYSPKSSPEFIKKLSEMCNNFESADLVFLPNSSVTNPNEVVVEGKL